MNIHLLLYCGEGGGRCAQLMTSFFFSGGGALDPPAAGKKTWIKWALVRKFVEWRLLMVKHITPTEAKEEKEEVAFMHSRNAMFVGWSS